MSETLGRLKAEAEKLSSQEREELAQFLIGSREAGAGIQPPQQESESTDVIRISPQAYLRAILVAAWGVFRYPLRTTYIDLSTGEAVHL